AVRAAFSGATNVVGRWTVPHCGIPPALQAVTAQRAVPATTDVRIMCGCALWGWERRVGACIMHSPLLYIAYPVTGF
ncbi:MAG TPA: hypothetical protein VGJ73_14445, partial [Verrucomicrobiae bacterium]